MHQVAVAKLEDRRAKIGCSCSVSALCLVLCCHFYLLIFRTQHEEELQAGTQLGHMRLVSCWGSPEMDTWGVEGTANWRLLAVLQLLAMRIQFAGKTTKQQTWGKTLNFNFVRLLCVRGQLSFWVCLHWKKRREEKSRAHIRIHMRVLLELIKIRN